MKRLSFLLIFSLSVVLFTACKDEDGPEPNAPSISSITPDSGQGGDTVTVNGSDFGNAPAVSFSGTDATIVNATETAISVIVPENLSAGAVEVTVTANGKTSNAATFTVGGEASNEVVITDADLEADTYNWTKDKSYFIDGLVFLEAGGVLNIEAGTTIRFKEKPSKDTDATSALFITKGAKIMAEGTANAPIIFTGEADVEGAVLDPVADNAQWGGLIILGNAPVSRKGVTENIQIEGLPTDESRGAYGGNDPEDNSGVLKYVSIRYTGIGFAPGDELQGLTLGGAGRGTTIDYVDIYSSADDGVEVFGGTVNISHVSVAFATDDDFDFDLGYRGNAQFLFSIAQTGDENVYDNAGEWDGADPDDAALFSAPNIFNATFIGPGQSASGTQRAILMRDAFAGKLGNSILEDFPGKGIQVEDRQNAVDSYERITIVTDGYQLEILSNTWAQFGAYDANADLASLVEATEGEDDNFTGATEDVVAELNDNNNTYSPTSVLNSISRIMDGGLDPRPAVETAASATVPQGMEQVNYRGAFAPGEAIWLSGWSTLAKLGYLTE